MTNQYVIIGIAVGVFVAGIGIGYGISQSTVTSNFMHMTPQQMQQMMDDPNMMNQWMGTMMNNPQTITEMHNMMMSNPQYMNQMMSTMMNMMMDDPQMQQQMMTHMMNNQGMMDTMMNNQDMMNMIMGNNMMDGNMMGNNMMGSGMMSSQSSQTIPTNEDPQTRIFQISMEEVEFYAEVKNEGEETIAFVELHRWEPNTIIVNQGDTVVLEITNPRKHAHTLSIPAFNINSEMLEPRGGVDAVTFVADSPGVFTFYCGLPYNPDKLYCDPDHSMMTGTLIVLE
ncbi:MAG: cupredoxin domain-containing protein [Nitrosarchaeum sp.]|nr:cupredoxin domain-containing protein [Nitrosarchaeum sp.]